MALTRITEGVSDLKNQNFRNKIINGNFDIWQRGTSFTDIDDYTADRWSAFGGGGVTNVSRQAFDLGQSDVSGNPSYFIRLNRTTAATDDGTGKPVLSQRVEDVRTLSGTTSTVSFWAKCSASKDFYISMLQSFGEGANASQDVIFDSTAVTVGTSWQKFTVSIDIPSVSGKTIDGTDHNLSLRVFESPTVETFTLDIARVQLEEGSVATPFEERFVGTELALCQRYYHRMTNVEGYSYKDTGSSVERRIPFFFPVEMREQPAVLEIETTTNTNISIRYISTRYATVDTDAVSSSAGIQGSATFDAEL